MRDDNGECGMRRLARGKALMVLGGEQAFAAGCTDGSNAQPLQTAIIGNANIKFAGSLQYSAM